MFAPIICRLPEKTKKTDLKCNTSSSEKQQEKYLKPTLNMLWLKSSSSSSRNFFNMTLQGSKSLSFMYFIYYNFDTDIFSHNESKRIFEPHSLQNSGK